MKTKLAMVAAIVLVFSLAAFAGKNSETVRFSDKVTVAGTQVAPGEYQLVWEGAGPDVQVSFMHGKKTVVTAPAKVVDQDNAEKAVVTSREGGSKELLSIELKKKSLIFSEASSSSGK